MPIEFNPDGGGSRVFHIAARAKQRFGLDLEQKDIEDMEAALKGGAVCPDCAEVLCDEECRFAEMRSSMRLVKVKPHGHEVWNISVHGKTVGVFWDPLHGTVRTVVRVGVFDEHLTVPMADAVRIVHKKNKL